MRRNTFLSPDRRPGGVGRSDRIRRSGSSVAFLPILLVASLFSIGCQVEEVDVTEDWTRGMPEAAGTPEQWRVISAAQAERLQALSVFSSAGTITLRWTDEDGSHVEQADHRIWRSSADRAAIRVSKVGSSLLLAGWNADRWWIFDETGDESVLRIRRLDAAEGSAGPDGLLSQPVLLAMLGFLPWPADPPADFQTAGSRSRFTVDPIRWGADERVPELPGRLVVGLADPGDGPIRLQLVDSDGRIAATATHEDFTPVETMGRPPGAWPDLARRVRIVRSLEDRVVISFDGPLAQGRVSERLFDVEALIERSRPDVIERSPEMEGAE